MLNGNGKLSSVSATNVCRRDGDVLLGTNTSTNTLEDHLHIGVPLPLKTNLTSILPRYMLRVWGSVLKFAFPLLMSSKNGLPHSTIACNVSLPITKGLQGCALGKIYEGPSGAQAFKLGFPGLNDRALWSPKHFSWGSRPASWSPKLVNP